MRLFWREPLVHFVGLGALLFAGHGLWEHYLAKDDYAISISTAELERQALIFAGENRRDPTDEDLQALIFAYVEEEVLMREALRRGLDADDTIIRRRLAQKMRFMIEDTEMPAPPEDAQLRAWFENRKDEFSVPETRAFVHIYLSPNTHGDDIESAAETLLMRGDLDNWETLGDPFIMKRTYTDVTRTDVSRMFGVSFGDGLFALPSEGWQDPLESAYGLHLVRLDKITPAKQPDFEAVKPSVTTAWQAEAIRAANQERLKTLVRQYKVEVEGLEP